jgi:hypothetical protein
MAYVIRPQNGHFIVIDGGTECMPNRENLMKYLRESSDTEKPVIACWFITHFDGDHFDAAYAIWRDHREDLDIRCFAAALVDVDDFAPHEGDTEFDLQIAPLALAVYNDKMPKWENVKKWYADSEFWDLKLGDERRFADVSVKVLITAHERVPESINSNNQRSAVLRFTFTQGTEDPSDDTTFLAFGDSYTEIRSQWLLDHYPESELRSHVMQPMHHGLAGGYLPVYEAVDPDICLWPTPKKRFEGRWESKAPGEPDRYQWCTDPDYNQYLRDDTIKVRRHYHHSQTTIIDMKDLSVTVIPSAVDDD